MTGEESRKLKDAEIKAEIASRRNRLFDLRSQTVTEKVDDVGEFKRARRDIARLLTERRARQIKAETSAAGPKAAEKVVPTKPAKKATTRTPARAGAGKKGGRVGGPVRKRVSGRAAGRAAARAK